MKNKKNTLIFAVFVFLSSFLFFSCNSTNFPIINQNKIFQENLYKEYLKLGDAYFEIEKYEDAISFYKKSMGDKSLNKIAEYKIGQCYCLISDWANALPIFEKFLEEDSDNLAIKSNLAYIYSMTGDYEKALSYYNELLTVNKNEVIYLENYLAILLSDKDIFMKNKEDFELYFNLLKENYPKNENITLFQDKFENLTGELEKKNEKATK